MLQKGLTRCGVRDAEHQRIICQAVLQLGQWSAEEVSEWHEVNCQKPPSLGEDT